jgi:hypothetical protein
MQNINLVESILCQQADPGFGLSLFIDEPPGKLTSIQLPNKF